jgi:hypothetical protein
MKAQSARIHSHTRYTALFAMLGVAALCAIPPAAAQHPQAGVTSVTYSDLALVRGSDLMSGTFRAEALTRKQWRGVEQQMRFDLASKDGAERALGLQSAIHLATLHPNQVKCKRVVPELLDIYLFERDDALRVMSVAALDAVGCREAIAIMAQRVRLERSPLVKHVTMHAVANHLLKEQAR